MREGIRPSLPSAPFCDVNPLDPSLSAAQMTEEVSDTLLRMAEAKQRVHRKELFLTHLRRQNIDKLEADADALCSLRANDGWMASKHSKFAMQREAARLERQLLSWRHTADTEFQAARVQLDKALQEEQRLETALRALEAAMSETKAKVVDEEEALRALQGEPDAESGPFGWFVDPEDLSITSGLSGLRVNIQRLDSLGSSSKVHALSCLEGRYTHLRSLAAELRRVNASAQMFRHDISLNSVIFAVQQQTAEALEASSVRLLLVDDTHQRLWCLEGAAGEEEQVIISPPNPHPPALSSLLFSFSRNPLPC